VSSTFYGELGIKNVNNLEVGELDWKLDIDTGMKLNQLSRKREKTTIYSCWL